MLARILQNYILDAKERHGGKKSLQIEFIRDKLNNNKDLNQTRFESSCIFVAQSLPIDDDFKTVILAHLLALDSAVALANQKGVVGQTYRGYVCTFLRECTDAVTHSQKKLRKMCKALVDSAVNAGEEEVMKVIQPLYLALRKSLTRSSCLTSLHTLLLQACLVTRCYHIATRLLETPVFEVMPKETGLTIEDYNCFWYYAARAHIGCKRYLKAKRALLECIATPAAHNICSAVAAEAFKYLVLVSLIIDGSSIKMNQMRSFENRRALGKIAETYITFADKFSARTTKKKTRDHLASLNAFVDENKKEFTKDNTMGLVSRCLKAFIRHKIANQTVTYVTLSLKDLAENAGCASVEEAEGVVLDMISQREIAASIDKSTNGVSFVDDEVLESGSERAPGLLQKIASETVKMLTIAKSLQQKDEALASSETYVRVKLGDARDAR